IRVTDNGSGISKDDVPVALLRHATSKVAQKDDLDRIATLGFRGEALASISAVSHMSILTRTAEDEVGTSCISEGGEVISVEDAGCPLGTTILVRDIFFNTPARMKFLKKDAVEGNAVAAVLDSTALSHPEISFRLIRDGKQVLHTPGDNKLRSAIYSVCGREFADGLIPVQYEYTGIKVFGFVSKPSAARASRSMQRFFINGRFIKSRTAMAALEEAFKGAVMVGKFPACVLHLQLSFETVDVNVHPTKLEVRFADERPVFNAVFHAVKSALISGDTPKEIQLKPAQPKPFQDNSVYRKDPVVEQLPIREIEQAERPAPVNPVSSAVQRPNSAKPGSWLKTIMESVPAEQEESLLSDSTVVPKEEKLFKTEEDFLSSLSVEKILPDFPTEEPAPLTAKVPEPTPVVVQAAEKTDAIVDDTEPTVPQPEKSFRVIGEVFKTYIFVQYGSDELVVIDKHAAHERMLYNKLKEENAEVFSQTLLAPVTVTLEKNEYSAVLERLDVLAKMGFETEDFGDGTVLVRTAPLNLNGADIAGTIGEIASYMVENRNDLSTEYMDWIYHNVACRAAIKGGDTTSDYELTRFVQMLLEHPEVRYCPHGRPAYVILKKRELEKQFGRIV
ncbi:MAG: DNA mismatch repair endonuclease MutL, partial [Clostridia bacterium]|nr:DNA mismatch repair endonuclease MutL [Clostridia bacterium]